MARRQLSPRKARKILHDKEVRGHELTDRQRRFMGAMAAGQPIQDERDADNIRSLLKRKPKRRNL